MIIDLVLLIDLDISQVQINFFIIKEYIEILKNRCEYYIYIDNYD